MVLKRTDTRAEAFRTIFHERMIELDMTDRDVRRWLDSSHLRVGVNQYRAIKWQYEHFEVERKVLAVLSAVLQWPQDYLPALYFGEITIDSDPWNPTPEKREALPARSPGGAARPQLRALVSGLGRQVGEVDGRLTKKVRDLERENMRVRRELEEQGELVRYLARELGLEAREREVS